MVSQMGLPAHMSHNWQKPAVVKTKKEVNRGWQLSLDLF